MKKFLLGLFILLLAFGGYTLYSNFKNKETPKLDVEEEKVEIEKLFIFGNHFNLSGNLVNDNDLELVLYNGNFIAYKINTTDDGFNLSNSVNEGILLDDVPRGKYLMFLRSTNKDEKGDNIYKYYVLNNSTEYKETIFYTFSNIGNKIIINSDNEYDTLMMSVNKSSDDNIYDVVVDPGHGGMDSGASKNGYKESDFTMKAALLLKEELEKVGVKVKLTREDGQLSSNETLPNYGVHGRAVVAHEVNAKYIISLHLNSNSYASSNGVEVYTPQNINYDLAKSLAKKITDIAKTNYSKNPVNKVFDGVYTRTFTQSDINGSLKEYQQKKSRSGDARSARSQVPG